MRMVGPIWSPPRTTIDCWHSSIRPFTDRNHSASGSWADREISMALDHASPSGTLPEKQKFAKSMPETATSANLPRLCLPRHQTNYSKLTYDGRTEHFPKSQTIASPTRFRSFSRRASDTPTILASLVIGLSHIGQTRMIQIQAIHQLIIIVTWHGMLIS